MDRPNPGKANDTANDPTCACPGNNGIGGVCPLGHHCPAASEYPQPCDAGSYADQIGMWNCTVCPPGYYCLANASDFLSTPCPTGKKTNSFYCI